MTKRDKGDIEAAIAELAASGGGEKMWTLLAAADPAEFLRQVKADLARLTRERDEARGHAARLQQQIGEQAARLCDAWPELETDPGYADLSADDALMELIRRRERDRDDLRRRLAATVGIVREVYRDLGPDECSCDSDKACDGTCLISRAREVVEREGKR